jgi:hypothetical protein
VAAANKKKKAKNVALLMGTAILEQSISFYIYGMHPVVTTNISLAREYKRWKYHCTVDLPFDWFGISSMMTDNFCFYLQNRLIQTSQTGGQRYSDTSPFSIPWFSR